MTRDKILAKYLRVCKAAATDDDAFRTFKSHPHYHEVLEHATARLGLAHFCNIRDNNPQLLYAPLFFDRFLQNDKYGSPNLLEFAGLRASPTTIQYISVLSNLIREFGDLDGFTICELGAGYFGQGKIIKDKFDIKRYDVIDLPECNLLQKKYAETLGCADNVEFFTNENYWNQSYDLFISNYALTEVSPADQLKYVQDVCLNSKRGYITANQPLNGIELLHEKFRNFKILPDIEGERKSNYVIVWTE